MYPNATPELRLGDVPNLCSYGPRPRLMDGLFVQLLRQHFAATATIEEPAMRSACAPLVWDADPLRSGIEIETAMTWRPRESMVRPAIVVRRNDWQVSRQGIGDRLMGYQAGDDGSEYYATFLTGSHTLFCVGEEIECEDLGAEVYREMGQFARVFWKAFKLHRFVVAEVGAPGRLQEAATAYVVPVTVAYAFEDVWRITPQSPFLKTISLTSILGG